MTLSTELACPLLALCLVALVLWFHEGRARQRARDEEWLENYFRIIRRDRESRDRLGRWLPKEFRHHDTNRINHH
jgi:hypothetical protein